MGQVINETEVLKELYGILGEMMSSGINNFGTVSQVIESSKNSGNLEPENYEQLMSSEYIGGDFQQVYYSAYQEQIPKMQQYLMELEKKLSEYLQIGFS